MMKALVTTLMSVILASAAASAASKFSNKTLKGAYVFNVIGFDRNDGGDDGQVAALGLLSFDGKGGFTGTLNLTSGDSGGDRRHAAPSSPVRTARTVSTATAPAA